TETCQAGVCAAGVPLNCDDGNACTTDTCNAVSGCVHTPIAGCVPCATAANCNDNNPCTTDSCVGGVSQNAGVANGRPCPAATVCKGTETWQAGVCTAGAPLNCDDGNPCTADTCDAVLGCQHTAVATGTPCPDATVCNGAETCQAGT